MKRYFPLLFARQFLDEILHGDVAKWTERKKLSKNIQKKKTMNRKNKKFISRRSSCKTHEGRKANALSV